MPSLKGDCEVGVRSLIEWKRAGKKYVPVVIFCKFVQIRIISMHALISSSSNLPEIEGVKFYIYRIKYLGKVVH